MIRTTVRRSRRYRECGGCGGIIPAGTLYRSCVASPGTDYADDWDVNINLEPRFGVRFWH